MSAFNDYCIVCEKLCTDSTAYCSEECKLKDTHSHFDFDTTVPQLISPMLQPRADSIANALTPAEPSDEEELEEESTHKEYLIKSPMLLSSTLKNESAIAGLNLDDCTPRVNMELDQHHTDLLAASSNYYRKWLNVNQI